ncbi:MAG: EAL domain-containing protein [Cyanosarcina radialis HA8281-LM2]|jgi:diguanylate cyclase (GGDEF)-like protein/PAS domain S-box-containing protein|nr:EAL domain-containing protein [Cyanosarcina radialis HA8281-LM2]
MLETKTNEIDRILIVEDEALVAEDIKDILEELGYSVPAILDTGELAIVKAGEFKPSLVLMDIRLKGKMDGVQAAQQIWNRFKIPVVYLTANSDNGTLQRAKETAPFGYITKPFREKELHTAVEIGLHRYRLEKQLKEREQWLETILSSMGDAVIATDDRGRIKMLNRTAEKLTGWQQSEACGQPSTEVFKLAHELSEVRVEDPIAKAIASGVIGGIPEKTILIAKNGVKIPIDDSAAPIKDRRGDIGGAVVVFRDIREQRRVQKMLETDREIAQILAESTVISSAISKLLQTVCEGLGWDLGEFWLADRQASVLRYGKSWHQLATVDRESEWQQFEAIARQFTFSKGVGLLGDIWKCDRPMWVTDMQDDTSCLRRWSAAKVGLRSAFGFPISSEGKTLGVMAFFASETHPTDPNLLKMMDAIGSQIGQFIERRRIENALRKSEQRLAWQATHDELTGLVNRREFQQLLEGALTIAKTQDRQHSLCYLDLDRFKIVNDTCGHAAGDELLRQVTALMRSQVRSTDILARLGGDEFGLLLKNCPGQQAMSIANSLRQSIQEFRFVWQDQTFTIGVSIGVVTIGTTTSNLLTALNAADAACYSAKNTGRNRVCFYQVDGVEAAKHHGQIQWVPRLTQALEQNLFRLYYQPIVPIDPVEYHQEHYEVLVRLEDDVDGVISPIAFIPAAERYHLMHLIDRWVIRTLFATQGPKYRQNWKSCQQRDRYLYSINLSGATLNDDDFVNFVREQFHIYQIPPEVICFEITETVAITNLGKAAKLIKELRDFGCHFALDDFGSGVSSFGYLKTLPVDYLKIDGNFVKDIVHNPTDLALTEAINRVGHAMGLKTIAEFVENNEVLAKLKDLGVDYAQGYGIAKPLPLSK